METALIEILKGSPALAVLLYVAHQFRKDRQSSEESYKEIVMLALNTLPKMETSLNGNTKVLERVEKKLDEKH